VTLLFTLTLHNRICLFHAEYHPHTAAGVCRVSLHGRFGCRFTICGATRRRGKTSNVAVEKQRGAGKILGSHWYVERKAGSHRVTALEPKDPMIRFRRAAAYMQTGRSQSAIDDFTAVLRLKPGFEQALMQRGKLYEKDLESYFANTHDETIQQTVRFKLGELTP